MIKDVIDLKDMYKIAKDIDSNCDCLYISEEDLRIDVVSSIKKFILIVLLCVSVPLKVIEIK